VKLLLLPKCQRWQLAVSSLGIPTYIVAVVWCWSWQQQVRLWPGSQSVCGAVQHAAYPEYSISQIPLKGPPSIRRRRLSNVASSNHATAPLTYWQAVNLWKFDVKACRRHTHVQQPAWHQRSFGFYPQDELRGCLGLAFTAFRAFAFHGVSKDW